ncbi:hypothetical protein LZ32DRAFT_311198 [Colletotrichum eremochloae]|nr:hypothetical protein LZ32DRAFT_311198 [Colletotrichum eremochloae]
MAVTLDHSSLFCQPITQVGPVHPLRLQCFSLDVSVLTLDNTFLSHPRIVNRRQRNAFCHLLPRPNDASRHSDPTGTIAKPAKSDRRVTTGCLAARQIMPIERRFFVRSRARRRLRCALPINPPFAVHHHHLARQSAVGLVDTNRTPTKCKSHRRRYLVWVPLRPALPRRYRTIPPFRSLLPLSLPSNARCSSTSRLFSPPVCRVTQVRPGSCTPSIASSHSGVG